MTFSSTNRGRTERRVKLAAIIHNYDGCVTQADISHTVGKGAPRQVKVGLRDPNGLLWQNQSTKAERDGMTSFNLSVGYTWPQPMKVFAYLTDNKGNLIEGTQFETDPEGFTKPCTAGQLYPDP